MKVISVLKYVLVAAAFFVFVVAEGAFLYDAFSGSTGIDPAGATVMLSILVGGLIIVGRWVHRRRTGGNTQSGLVTSPVQTKSKVSSFVRRVLTAIAIFIAIGVGGRFLLLAVIGQYGQPLLLDLEALLVAIIYLIWPLFRRRKG